MNSKEALETLGNVEVAVTTIKSGITQFKTLKEQYETEFEVLEKELLFTKDIKPFDVYQKQLEQLEKENTKLKQAIKILKEHIGISFYDESLEVYIYEDEYSTDFSCLTGFEKSEIDKYLLLKQVFESVGGE